MILFLDFFTFYRIDTRVHTRAYTSNDILDDVDDEETTKRWPSSHTHIATNNIVKKEMKKNDNDN